MFNLGDVSVYSLLLAAILSVYKLRSVSADYLPFFIFIWLGLLNEVVSVYCIKHFHSNAINSNLYVLLEALLIVWQFKKWAFFRNTRLYLFTVAFFAVFWFIEFGMVYSLKTFSSYFRIVYSFIIVLMSIVIVNRLIVHEQHSILKSSVFLICTSFILFFTYKLLVEIFWVYGLNSSSHFRSKVYEILNYVNIISNLIYATAILWIPRKQEFIQPS